MVINIKREICEGCCKQIFRHNKCIICSQCNKIAHYKCSNKTYTYDQVKDYWSCWECTANIPLRYNPFDSIFYNKYQVEDPEAFEETNQVTNILNNCKIFSATSLDKTVLAHQDNHALSVLFNNIDGVTSNFDKLHAELSLLKNRFSIITLAETNIDSMHKDMFKLPGYQSVYQSKISNKHKGSGLGIHINEDFVYDTIVECSQCSKDIESLFIKIDNPSQPIIIGVVYRPPNGSLKNFLTQFDNLLELLPDSNVIITGDFNINLHQSNISDFEDTFFGHGFVPLISLATHFKPGCNPSCIDNIFVNTADNVTLSGVSENCITHHHPIFCCYQTDSDVNDCTTKTKNYPKYDYCESNFIKFNECISTRLESGPLPYDENGFNTFSVMLTDTIDECFLTDPQAYNSRRNRLINPWITSGLINSIEKKNTLYKKWKKTVTKKLKQGDVTLYTNYKNYRKNLKFLISNAKKLYYSKKFDQANGNSKKTWEIINELRGKEKSKNKSSFIVNGEIIKDRRTIANEFNQYFVSIAVKMNSITNIDCDGIPILSIPDFMSYMDCKVKESIYLHECSPDEIGIIIQELNSGKASDIAINVLKRCCKIISPYLCKFYNNFMETGSFPAILKTGQISPIYKKGNPQLMENYRPVSTLPCLGKIYEKIIYSRLYSFLISKNILYDNQFGFRKKHSTSQAINYSVDKIIEGVENNKHIIGIFIDLSKAFDTINFEKLLSKLENYGIRGTPLNLIRNYISGRSQCVNFINTKSGLSSVLYGVPQGSVLGPLLFLLYINDIVKSASQGHFVLFADDTNIFVTAVTEEKAYKLANKVLQNVYKYMVSNQLHINLNKCVYMHFKPRLNNDNRKTCARARAHGNEHSLSLNGVKLKKVDKVRFLGVIIDDQLSWEHHIKYLEEKLNSSIITIKRIKKFIPKDHYKKLYHSLFACHLTYGITAWGGTSVSKLQKLFAIQKRCVRLLFGDKLSYDHAEFYETCARVRTYQEHKSPKNFVLEHTKPLFNKLNFLTLQNLYKLYIFNDIFKILKYHCPISILLRLQLNKFSHRQLLTMPKYKLNNSRNQFIFRGTAIWNAVSHKVFNSPELHSNLNIIIPGSCPNSDFSTSVGFTKNKLKKILQDIQSKGNPNIWIPTNFKLT